jgi:hypothetical protein
MSTSDGIYNDAGPIKSADHLKEIQLNQADAVHAQWQAQQDAKKAAAGKRLSPDEIAARASGTEIKTAS